MKIKVNNKLYDLKSNFGSNGNQDGKERKLVRLDFNYNYADFQKIGLQNDVQWSLIETGDLGDKEYDMSSYNVLCDVVLHNNNTVSAYMGKTTNEELQAAMIEDLLEATND